MKNYILITISILLSISVTQAQRKTQENITTGTVRGVITDKTTMKPIEEAEVQIAYDTIKTKTNARGEYILNDVPTGYRIIYVTADGYPAHLSESFEVLTSTPAIQNVKFEVINSKEVVVTASSPLRSTIESPVSMRRIGREEIDLTPGANRDISKVVQSSPGVVTVGQNNRNDLLVRGGGANENRYFLDDIEIPVLNHFSVQGGSGGYASLVNTDLLSSTNFYTGSFPAAFSNGLSSVLDMKMKEGNPDKFHAKIIAGTSDAAVSIDTPLAKNGKTTLVASYRRSYLQVLFDMLSLPFLPTYNDYQFKLTSKLSDRDEIFVMGLGSFDNNKLNLNLRKKRPSSDYISGYLPNNDQTSYVVGVGYRHSFDGGQVKVTASRDYLKNDLYKFENNDQALDKTLDLNTIEANYRMKAIADWWNVGGFRISTGIGGGYGSYQNRVSQRIFIQEQATRLNNSASVYLWRYNAFATASRYFFDQRLSVLVALRMDGMNYSSQTANPLRQLSPRLSLSYRFSNKWSLNATVARYYQEPTYTTLGYVSPTSLPYDQRSNLRYLAVNQYIAGVKFSPNAESMITLEGFFKQYNNLPVSLIDSLVITTGNLADYIVGDVPAASVGKGRAYGAELSYRNINFFGAVVNFSYTLLYSQANKLDKNLQPTSSFFNSSWDVRHIFNIYAIYKLPRHWSVGAKWYFTGGMPYTPYNYELSSLIEAWDARKRPYIDNSQYNEGRTGTYHQLDIRIDKVWYFPKWRIGFYIDIQNLYNFKSVGQEFLLPQTDSQGKYIVDPSRPGHYKMQTISNDNVGTILPTIGITIEF